MPIYEYRCNSCSAEFDEMVRMGTPDEEIECPECGKHKAKRLLSMFASGSARSGSGLSSSAGSSSCGSSGFG